VSWPGYSAGRRKRCRAAAWLEYLPSSWWRPASGRLRCRQSGRRLRVRCRAVGSRTSGCQPPAAVGGCCRACGPLPAFAPETAAEILAGLTISPWPAVRIDPRHDGGVDWSLDPFHRSTWFQTYQSGSWIEALIGRYLDDGPGADAYWAWARALLLSWLRDVPHPGPRPLTLICPSEAFPGQAGSRTRFRLWSTTRPRAGREPGIMGSSKTCRSWASDAPARPVPSAGRL
jgi:hypothetical protein